MTEGLKPGPLTVSMVPLLTAGRSVLRVRSYGDQEKLATFIHASGEGDHIVLKVDEEGQTAPNCWGIHRFSYIGERGDDGWISWSGGPEPIPHSTPGLHVRCRNGVEHEARGFMSHYWLHDGDAHDIIAFRLVSESPALPLGEGKGSSAQEADTHRATDGAVLVLKEPDAGLLSVIASMVRRIAVPTSIDPDEVYFDNGHARKIYQAVIDAAPKQPSVPTEGHGTGVVGWQPIETAPKDGTHFLAVDECGDACRCAYHSHGYIMSFCGQPVVQPFEPILWRPWIEAPPAASVSMGIAAGDEPKDPASIPAVEGGQ